MNRGNNERIRNAGNVQRFSSLPEFSFQQADLYSLVPHKQDTRDLSGGWCPLSPGRVRPVPCLLANIKHTPFRISNVLNRSGESRYRVEKLNRLSDSRRRRGWWMCLFVSVCVYSPLLCQVSLLLCPGRDLFAFHANIKVFLLMVQFFFAGRRRTTMMRRRRRSVYVAEGSLIIAGSVCRSLLIKQMDHEGGFFRWRQWPNWSRSQSGDCQFFWRFVTK